MQAPPHTYMDFSEDLRRCMDLATWKLLRSGPKTSISTNHSCFAIFRCIATLHKVLFGFWLFYVALKGPDPPRRQMSPERRWATSKGWEGGLNFSQDQAHKYYSFSWSWNDMHTKFVSALNGVVWVTAKNQLVSFHTQHAWGQIIMQ